MKALLFSTNPNGTGFQLMPNDSRSRRNTEQEQADEENIG
jgi:hypothetical protein